MKALAYTVIDHHLTHLDTKTIVPIDKDAVFSLSIRPIRKGAKDTILNAFANALSNSMANGDEKINITITITSPTHSETLIVNQTPLVRHSLDYHESIRAARKLIEQCKRL